MSEIKHSGPRKLTESEKKLGSTLLAQLYFAPDEPVDVVIIGSERIKYDKFLEAITGSLVDMTSVRNVSGVMISATVSPPDIRSQLSDIAAKNEVSAV